MSLRVLELFGIATLQDAGRPGWRRFGVPTGGAFDAESFALGNRLIANRDGAPALEMALGGGRFVAEADAYLAWVGAEGPASLNSEVLQSQSAFAVRTGDVLEIRSFARGARAYLCAAGGFMGAATLGSVSGDRVFRTSTLSVAASKQGPPKRLRSGPSTLDGRAIRCVPGPRHDLVDVASLESIEFEVAQRSGRAGVRLLGLASASVPDAPSEPSCFGAVQLTPSGELIVVGPDGPTIGGYPAVAVVCSADLGRVAQLRPGDLVRLKTVELCEARRLAADERRRLDAWLAQIDAAGRVEVRDLPTGS